MERKYVEEAKKSKGKKVTVAGWVHEFRNIGKVRFIVLRDKTGVIQITAKKGVIPDELLEKFSFNREDVVKVTGKVTENKIAPDGMEIIPEKVEILNKVEKKLPVDPSDMVPSDLDTRLDYRYIDLRRKVPAAIFSIKSKAAQAFREKCLKLNFQEIHPTSLTGTATEGGTEVFPILYFDRKAFLAQSPQLYKQLAIIGGMDKVYMTVPVFRAEKHATTSHLNEIIQMDIEAGFIDHNQAMDILEEVFLHILKTVEKECKDELEVLKVKLDVPKKLKRYTYDEVVNLLIKNKFEIKWGEDLSKEAEKKLDELLEDDAYFIYEWPTETRAFYSMPNEKNDKICHAFDLMYKGLEIASGAQRIHIPELLETQIKKRGLDPKDFEFYINAFRMGAPPHSGWSIGLERLVQKITNQSNIRECMLFPRDRHRLHP